MIGIDYIISSIDNLDVRFLPDGTTAFSLSGSLQEMTPEWSPDPEQPPQCPQESERMMLGRRVSEEGRYEIRETYSFISDCVDSSQCPLSVSLRCWPVDESEQ
jgi:hypothetical protein